MKIQLRLSEKQLDILVSIGEVTSAESGGTDVFIGTVRNETQGKKVVRLEFEAYEKMALREMRRIAEQAFEQWPVQAVSIHHRTGVLEPGEVAVIISVAAAHRAAAFDACRFVIDRLKECVPIWKKEVFEDGEIWVAAHP